MANWAELLPDLLFMIVERIKVPEDFVSFGCVCSTWQATMLRKGATKSLQPFPYLILDIDHMICTFYSFGRDKICRVPIMEDSLVRPVTTNWWIFYKNKLLNPFSRREIPLPALNSYEERYVLSSNPSFTPDDYIVMIINSKSRLAFWKAGDEAWTEIDTYNAPFKDILYYRGQFYAADEEGVIYVCDVRGCNPTVANAMCKLPKYQIALSFLFLVDCVGIIDDNRKSILLGYYYDCGYMNEYQLYEVDLSGKGGWEDVTVSSQDRTVFLYDENESFGIQGSKFLPGIIKANWMSLRCSELESCNYIDCVHDKWIKLIVRRWTGYCDDFDYHPQP